MNATGSMRNAGRPPKGSRPLADYVDPCVAPALAKYGFGQADLITCWPDIVGERIASYSEPIRLQWGRRSPGQAKAAGPQPATLILRVEGGGALELQHMTEAVIERINTHLGWRCVGKLALRQGPLAGRPEPRRRARAPAPAAVEIARLATAGIEADPLRDALVRLGSRVLDPGR